MKRRNFIERSGATALLAGPASAWGGKPRVSPGKPRRWQASI